MSDNCKYRITDIAHPEYPFLHRIQALQNIGGMIHPGDLGGYVQIEANLSIDPNDAAWIFDDAIACHDALVEKNAGLMNQAIACDRALVTQGALVLDDARIEDDACLSGGILRDAARLSGFGIVTFSNQTKGRPYLSDQCTVYGAVSGDVNIFGSTVILGEEKIHNQSHDTWILRDGHRTVERSPKRLGLQPEPYDPNNKNTKRKKNAYER